MQFEIGTLITHTEWPKDQKAKVVGNFKDRGMFRLIGDFGIKDGIYSFDDEKWSEVKK